MATDEAFSARHSAVSFSSSVWLFHTFCSATLQEHQYAACPHSSGREKTHRIHRFLIVCPLIDCCHGRLGAAGCEIPESTQTHQIHRKHTSVKILEEEKGSEWNHDKTKGTSGAPGSTPAVPRSFGGSGDGSGAVLVAQRRKKGDGKRWIWIQFW